MAPDLVAVFLEQGHSDLAEYFIDGSVVQAKKGTALSDAGRKGVARRSC